MHIGNHAGDTVCYKCLNVNLIANNGLIADANKITGKFYAVFNSDPYRCEHAAEQQLFTAWVYSVGAIKPRNRMQIDGGYTRKMHLEKSFI
jgi:hypothetical protein